jgi:hypothetical protein
MMRLEIESKDGRRRRPVGSFGGLVLSRPWTGQRCCCVHARVRQGQPVPPAVESGYGQNSRHAGQTRCTSPAKPAREGRLRRTVASVQYEDAVLLFSNLQTPRISIQLRPRQNTTHLTLTSYGRPWNRDDCFRFFTPAESHGRPPPDGARLEGYTSFAVHYREREREAPLSPRVRYGLSQAVLFRNPMF